MQRAGAVPRAVCTQLLILSAPSVLPHHPPGTHPLVVQQQGMQHGVSHAFQVCRLHMSHHVGYHRPTPGMPSRCLRVCHGLGLLGGRPCCLQEVIAYHAQRASYVPRTLDPPWNTSAASTAAFLASPFSPPSSRVAAAAALAAALTAYAAAPSRLVAAAAAAPAERAVPPRAMLPEPVVSPGDRSSQDQLSAELHRKTSAGGAPASWAAYSTEAPIALAAAAVAVATSLRVPPDAITAAPAASADARCRATAFPPLSLTRCAALAAATSGEPLALPTAAPMLRYSSSSLI